MAIQIQVPTLGPVVGATGTTTTNIWLRAKPGSTRRHGVVKLDRAGATFIRCFEVASDADGTGVAAFSGLNEDTVYTITAGWVEDDREAKDLQVALSTPGASSAIRWGPSNGSVCTASNDPRAKRVFLAGSCRYPNWIQSDDDAADLIFKTMLEDHPDSNGVIFCGDQIYADPTTWLVLSRKTKAAKTLTEYFNRYHLAFHKPHFAALLARRPTYMILDDHEIKNNHPLTKISKGQLADALHVYGLYQASHGPAYVLNQEGVPVPNTPTRWWYSYRDGCCDIFVMDTRMERDYAKNLMVGIEQLTSLKRWLKNDSDRVKVIVSAVPFVPDLTNHTPGDRWSGFPQQRLEILEHIRTERIRRVVFISGDIHCSYAVEVRHNDDPMGERFNVIQVVSSPLHFQFNNSVAWNFKPGYTFFGAAEGGYQVLVPQPADPRGSWLPSFPPADSFARIELSPTGVDVRFCKRSGGDFPQSRFGALFPSD